MYDVIEGIINHTWVTTSTGEQQYIMYTCCALIIILTVVFIDVTYRVFRHFWR